MTIEHPTPVRTGMAGAQATQPPGRRFLLHTRASGGGGAERVFATLAGELVARGHHVTLAVDRIEGDVFEGVTLVPLGDGHGAGIRALAALIRHGRFDAAAAAVSVSNVKLVAARLLARRRIGLAVSYHGFEEYKTGRLSALAYRGMPVVNWTADRIVAVSDGLRDALVGRWGADPARTVRIYNPVRFPSQRPPTAVELAARPPVVAAVGRLSSEKGFDRLITAFARVRTPGATLLLAGEGPERGALQHQIESLDLVGRVELVGVVSGSEAIFARARVAAVPSRTEAFGLAVVEALAAGLPVVATDCDGPREILAGGRFGTLVPRDDATAFAAALDAALAETGDPSARRERAETFSVEAGVDAWERLLNELSIP